jgi:hypothetical protein
MTSTNPDHDNRTRHEEWLMDEAIRGSFPASDPASSSAPGSIVNRRYTEAAQARPRTTPAVVAAALVAITVALALPSGQALAQDKATYDQRSIARYEQQFATLDRDRSNEVSRADVEGDVAFTAAFDDIDINRDGVMTKAELDRFLALRYGATQHQ